MTEGRGLVSIWFLIGVLLLIYGVIITVSSFVVPSHTTALAHLHPELWWGVLLTVIGVLYTVLFRPRRRSR